MQKIVFLSLSLTKGGAERVIANMCNEYFADRYQVTIITCMRAPVEYPIRKEIEIRTLDTREDEWTQGMAGRFARRRAALKRELQLLRPDLVISFLPEPNFLALSLRKSLKIPTIISVRNDPNREYAGTARQLLMRRYYGLADGYVFQTDQAREYFSFSKHIMECSKVIPNPLSRAYLTDDEVETGALGITPDAEAEGFKKSTKIILNVGRLERQKDQKTLIEAFDLVADEYEDWNLEICGEGSLREELETQIETCQRKNRVILCGNVDNIRDKMKHVDLFVLSSIYEGMPNALMEAMAMGLPVISTDCPCGGPAMLIPNEDRGILVPVGDAEWLARQMRLVMGNRDKARRLGENARNIRTEFNPEAIYQKWDECVTRLIGDR